MALPADLEALILELRGKNLLTPKDEAHLELDDSNDARVRILAYLDALTDSNEITSEDADRYIARLSIKKEKVDDLRGSNRDHQMHKRSLN